jgi:hypothetical protein
MLKAIFNNGWDEVLNIFSHVNIWRFNIKAEYIFCLFVYILVMYA